jgi:hypothetical protein
VRTLKVHRAGLPQSHTLLVELLIDLQLPCLPMPGAVLDALCPLGRHSITCPITPFETAQPRAST